MTTIHDDGATTFTGSSWRIPISEHPGLFALDEIAVTIYGLERPDGTVTRWVHVSPHEGDLPVASARLLSAAMADAVAEIERLER